MKPASRFNNSLRLNFKRASRHIQRVAGRLNPKVQFQVVPERKGSNARAWTACGTLSGLADRLSAAQRDGCGIFFCINQTDGNGRRRVNIEQARACFIDLDGTNLPAEWAIEPQLIVETSPGRFHAYWFIEPTTDLNTWSSVQSRLASYYASDPSVTDPPRVLRLSGSWHLKGEPFRVRDIKCGDIEDAMLDGFDRIPIGELEKMHPCDFIAPAIRSDEGRSEQPEHGWDNKADDERATSYLIDAATAAIENEQGDKTTFQTACVMRDMGVSENRAIELMAEHYNPRCIPPWNEDDLRRKIRNAYRYASGDAGSLSTENAPDDFGGELALGAPPSGGASSPLEKLNHRYTAVYEAGRFRVMHREENLDMPGRKYWVSSPEGDFCKFFSNRKVQVSPTRKMPLGKAWIEWPHRATANGAAFDPKSEPATILGNGRLNLWTGWGVTPCYGDWSLFREMIRNVLCSGNDEHFEYVLRWLAWTLQNPGLPSEVALVFRGLKGLGKGTIGETMITIFGSHGLAVSRRDQFAGRFSGHLSMACFVFADEAVWGGNKEDEGTLKKLITDRHVLYEAKGKDAVPGVNRVSLMMATNEDWAAPASFDERRFAIFEVASKRRVEMDAAGNDPNRQYWNQIHQELSNGGREAFLDDMLCMDLTDWHPRQDVPRTDALGAQMLEGLKGIHRWYFEMLSSGTFPTEVDGDVSDWTSSNQQALPQIIVKDCMEWSKRNRSLATVTAKGLLSMLTKAGWEKRRTGNARYWIAPSLRDARLLYAKMMLGGHNPFEEASDD